MSVVFDPKVHCGAKNRHGSRCTLVKGWGTKHKNAGRCRKHGGNTPTGRQAGQLEVAKRVLADLAIPVDGNPLQVLQSVLASAHGIMTTARQMLRELPTEKDVSDEKAWAVLKLYRESIESAGRMAKLAAEAINEDALVQLDLETGAVIHRILVAALDAYEDAPAGEGRKAAEEAFVRELVAVGPTSDERN